MSVNVIIIICILLLIAYVFDFTAKRTKIPSVILLLLLGWISRQAVDFAGVPIPDLYHILPPLGTLGLVLIVLDGALELKIKQENLSVIGKSSLVALIPLVIMSLILANAIMYFSGTSFRIALENAIPFAVISSAIAIPSAKNLMNYEKEFITYESSLSDIYGIMFFNFINLNNTFGILTFTSFFLDIFLILVISFFATLFLAFLLTKINHHIKFLPIIILIVLIFSVSKVFHLPSLMFVVLFGLFLNNIDQLKNIEFIQRLRPQVLGREIVRFAELTGEMTFLIRSLFFLLFGFLIKTHELIDPESLYWSVPITVLIFILRWIILCLFKLESNPLVYIAPRGLITILLYMSIPTHELIPFINNATLIQVIVLSGLFLMFGMILYNKKEHEKLQTDIDDYQSEV